MGRKPAGHLSYRAVFVLHSLGLASLFFAAFVWLVRPASQLLTRIGASLSSFGNPSKRFGARSFFCGGITFFHGRLSVEHDSDLTSSFFEFFGPLLCQPPSSCHRSNWFKVCAVVWRWQHTLDHVLCAARIFFFDDDSRRLHVGKRRLYWRSLYWWNYWPREMFFYGMIGFPADPI